MISWLIAAALAAPPRDPTLADPAIPVVEQPWVGPVLFAVIGVGVIVAVMMATRKRL